MCSTVLTKQQNEPHLNRDRQRTHLPKSGRSARPGIGPTGSQGRQCPSTPSWGEGGGVEAGRATGKDLALPKVKTTPEHPLASTRKMLAGLRMFQKTFYSLVVFGILSASHGSGTTQWEGPAWTLCPPGSDGDSLKSSSFVASQHLPGPLYLQGRCSVSPQPPRGVLPGLWPATSSSSSAQTHTHREPARVQGFDHHLPAC